MWYDLPLMITLSSPAAADEIGTAAISKMTVTNLIIELFMPVSAAKAVPDSERV